MIRLKIYLLLGEHLSLFCFINCTTRILYSAPYVSVHCGLYGRVFSTCLLLTTEAHAREARPSFPLSVKQVFPANKSFCVPVHYSNIHPIILIYFMLRSYSSFVIQSASRSLFNLSQPLEEVYSFAKISYSSLVKH